MPKTFLRAPVTRGDVAALTAPLGADEARDLLADVLSVGELRLRADTTPGGPWPVVFKARVVRADGAHLERHGATLAEAVRSVHAAATREEQTWYTGSYGQTPWPNRGR